MPFVIEQDGVPEVQSSEVFYLSCLLTLLPNPSTSQQRKLRVRVYVDDVETSSVRSATWSHDDSRIAGQLTLELANLSDRSLFTRTAEIKCQVEEYLTGVWTVIKTYCDGAILATSNYTLQNNDLVPDDSFTVTVLPLLQQRLDLSPEQIVVLHDPAKVTVNDEDLETVPNIDGTVGTVTVTPIANMTLQSVLEWVADTLGFAGVLCGINTEPWELSRVDFPAGQPYWSTIAGIIGNHEPKLSIDADNKLVIKDGTALDPVGARTMTLTNFRSLQLNKNIERFKGTILTRQLIATEYDYWELRQERKSQWFGGVIGQYPLTEVIEWYQDFYRNSFPNTPVFSQLFSMRQLEYETGDLLTSATAERFSYQFGAGHGIRITRHEVKEWGFANVPSSWVTFNATIPGPNTEFAGAFSGPEESYTSANNTTFAEAFVLTRAEQTLYTYVPMFDGRDASYVGQTDTETRGLITRDTANQQLGSDFDQSWAKAQESGNLAEGQDAYWGSTDFRKEFQKAEKKRSVSLRTRRHTPLNSTRGLIAENYLDRRKGDVADSDIQTETTSVKITEGGDATASLWRTLNGGEAPLVVLQPLCHRLNRKQDYPGGISANLPTYDATMDIGQIIDPQIDGRTAVSLGIFETIGYTDVFEQGEGGMTALTSIRAKQVG